MSRKWSVNIIFFMLLLLIIATPGTLVPIAVRQANTLTVELDEVMPTIEEAIGQPLTVLNITVPIDQIWANLTDLTPNLGSAVDSALTVVETTSTSIFRLVIITAVC